MAQLLRILSWLSAQDYIMNFKLIYAAFNERVHVWGAYGFTMNSGETRKDFIPVKRLKELQNTTSKIKLIAQSYANPGTEIYCEEFKTEDLFAPETSNT